MPHAIGWFKFESPAAFSRGPKDLKNDTGSVILSKHLAGTPPFPLPSKKGYVRLNKAFLGGTYYYGVVGEQENISACLYKLQEGIFNTQLVQI